VTPVSQFPLPSGQGRSPVPAQGPFGPSLGPSVHPRLAPDVTADTKQSPNRRMPSPTRSGVVNTNQQNFSKSKQAATVGTNGRIPGKHPGEDRLPRDRSTDRPTDPRLRGPLCQPCPAIGNRTEPGPRFRPRRRLRRSASARAGQPAALGQAAVRGIGSSRQSPAAPCQNSHTRLMQPLLWASLWAPSVSDEPSIGFVCVTQLTPAGNGQPGRRCGSPARTRTPGAYNTLTGSPATVRPTALMRFSSRSRSVARCRGQRGCSFGT
jgi:hypothetical protein